jgi:hypothetical protein
MGFDDLVAQARSKGLRVGSFYERPDRSGWRCSLVRSPEHPSSTWINGDGKTWSAAFSAALKAVPKRKLTGDLGDIL